MPQIKYKDNSKDLIKLLKKRHGALPIVAANTVNNAVKVIGNKYKKSMNRDFKIRNKFTKGAIKLQLSRAKRSSGDFRKIPDINARLGVRKLRGGKDHYMKDQELGRAKRGHRDTAGKVAIPITKNIRRGGSQRGVIKGPMRLQKQKAIQTLKLSGYGDFNNTGRLPHDQQGAILYKYMGTGKSPGLKKDKRFGTNPMNWDLKTPFVWHVRRYSTIGIRALQKVGKKIKAVRGLDKNIIRIKPTHGLQEATERLTEKFMETNFNREAAKVLKK